MKALRPAAGERWRLIMERGRAVVVRLDEDRVVLDYVPSPEQREDLELLIEEANAHAKSGAEG